MVTDETQSLRVAIIGYGLAGAVFHAPLVAATPGAAVAAIVTTNPERQAQARRDFPGAAILASVDEIWHNAQDYDLIVVASPNRYHAEQGIAAMQAGLPVVIDKPLAPNAIQAQGLVSVSKKTGVSFTCFQNRRWDGDFLTVRKLINSGLLGPITRFESRFERYRAAPKPGAWRELPDPAEAGGLLFDLGSHLIDQAMQLFGTPERVYAEMPLRRPGAQVDDDTFVALQFPTGINAHLWMSSVAVEPVPRFLVRGLSGTFTKYGLDPQEDKLREGRRPGEYGWGSDPMTHWGKLVADVKGVAVTSTIETELGAYETFYASVRDAVRDQMPMPVDPADVIAALNVIEAAQRSAQTGNVVTV
ncbi:MAG TPA: Gfo/Idh/MocA family oxidoreductase [Ktedonobacterales bacterium]|nr:Gfo/Idh/MocA family oxidoreductase [Ktedonobacterales bacterium]